MKNIFIQAKWILRLALTSFRTTRSWISGVCLVSVLTRFHYSLRTLQLHEPKLKLQIIHHKSPSSHQIIFAMGVESGTMKQKKEKQHTVMPCPALHLDFDPVSCTNHKNTANVSKSK